MTTWNTGAQPVVVVDPTTGEPATTALQKKTFHCAFGFVVAATPTTVVEIIGAANKRIRIKEIWFDGTVASSLGFDFTLNKRSVAATGGSSTNQDSIPNETGVALPGLVVKAYTANPTPGTLVGRLKRNVFSILTTASTTYRNPDSSCWVWDDNDAPLLTSASDILTIDMASPATSPTRLDVSIVYFEENP